MTEADRYWQRKVIANKSLATKSTRVTIGSEALEKEIRKAFEAGRQVGIRQGFKLGQNSQIDPAEKTLLDELFDQIGE